MNLKFSTNVALAYNYPIDATKLKIKKKQINYEKRNITTFSSSRCNSVIKHNYFIINA